MRLLPWLEDQRAQRGAERQGDEPRDRHSSRDRDSELLIELSGYAAQKGNGHKHRAEYQHDGNNGPAHFLHGIDCRLLARFSLLHMALDVFHHHDRVVDDDADGQDHAEQGEGVDRKA